MRSNEYALGQLQASALAGNTPMQWLSSKYDNSKRL